MADLTEYDHVATELVDLIRQYPQSDYQLIIFGFFSQHLDYLDLPLIDALTKIFRTSPKLEIAEIYLRLGNRLSAFPYSNKINIIEIGIGVHKLALEVYTKQEYLKEWREIQFVLALQYDKRIKGDKSENIELTIDYYESISDVYTKEDFSKQWAKIRSDLSFAYLERIKGNRADNLEQAIEYSQAALEIYNQKDFPIYWGLTQGYLAMAYGNRIKGNRADNLEQAIEYYQAALGLYNQQDFPIQWAESHANLGAIYTHRIKGDKADNLELSIGYSEAALTIYNNQQDCPIKLGRTQANLIAAYSTRIKGDKADNIERAIEYSQAALKIYNQQDSSIQWALIQANLGVAYSIRIKGDRADNIERAIEYSQAAIEIYNQQDFPIECARSQANIGAAYPDRIKGDRADNIERAIEYSKAAIEIYNQQDFPIECARCQANLGVAYRNRIKGDKADNIELSIGYSEAALEICTQQNCSVELGQLQTNLGAVYSTRIKGDRADNIERAIEYSEAALEINTKTDLPIDWARTQHNLGVAYSNRSNGDRAENLERAIEYFKLALEINTSEHLPIDCLRTAQSLGELHFNQGNWQQAIDSYETAMQAAETSRSWSVNDSERQRVLTEALRVYENAIQCAVNLKDYKKAIECTERVRSRQLVELIASKDLYSDAQVPAEIQAYLTEYQQLNQRIENLRPPGNDRSGITTTSRNSQDLRKDCEQINQAKERKQVLYNQIRAHDRVLAGQIVIAPISHNEIQKLITSPHTAILTFYSTNDDTHIFILKHDREPELFTCTSQGWNELQKWLRDRWLIPDNETDNKQWRTEMPEVLAEISARLQLPQLIVNHLTDIHELVLVPHLLLHQIPFAALPILGSEQLLGEKFTIRSIPSCQILQYCQERPPIHTNVQGIVEDADDSLMGARYEGQKIAEIYSVSDGDRLRGKTQATITNYRQLLGRVNRLHSCHHASSNLNNPLESALKLADGKITLGDLLLGERYQNLDEIFLSACETHVGKYTFTDDVTTITTGFLCIGARSVQSTLWSVDDLVTAIFDVFYHQERREGYNRAVSLKRAQIRLRYLSGEEFRINHYPELKQFLDKFLPSELDKLDQKIDRLDIAKKTAIGDDKDEISRELKQLDNRYRYLDKELKPLLDDYCKQAYPFAAPYYWAGFMCQGMA